MKILIIRFSSIGDIVLTTPVIRCLRKKYPGADIHFLTKKNFSGIVLTNPYINRVLILADDINATIEILKNEKFDYIIDLHNNLRTLRIKQGLEKSAVLFFQQVKYTKMDIHHF